MLEVINEYEVMLGVIDQLQIIPEVMKQYVMMLGVMWEV